MLDVAALRDRCRGALIGVGLGDALGAPFEGRPAPADEEIDALIRATGDLLFTDDTAMTIAVGEAIVAAKGLDQDDLVQHLAVRYLAEPGRGYGSTPEVLRAVHAGIDWRTAADRGGRGGLRGDGAAMRVAPVAIAAYHDPEQVDRWAIAQAEVTHVDPTAIDGARLIALATRHALISPAPLRLSHRARLVTQLAAAAHTADLAAGLNADPPSAGSALAGTAAAAVPAAIHVAARHGDSVVATIGAAIALGGDTDTVAAMSAGIVGAHLGLADIPTELVDRLEDHDRLIGLADELLELAIRFGPLPR